jgi:hypothetical protein
MYLAQFEAAGGDWTQAAARIETGRAGAAPAASWSWAARQLAALLRLPEATVARRIHLDADRNLDQVIGLTAPVAYAPELRAALARLTRTERFTGASMLLPQSRAQRDAWFAPSGVERFCSAGDAYSVRGIAVACDFRVLPLLDRLLADACVLGHALTYQVHVRALTPDPEDVRAVRKLALALSEVPGGGRLLDWQQGLARRFAQATAICEEYLAVDSGPAAQWLQSWLAERFIAAYAALGFSASPRLRSGGYEDALAAGVHSYDLEPWSAADLCASALDADERDALLAWRPSYELAALLRERDADDEPAVAAAPAGGPRTYGGEARYAFASYKREELPLIAPIMQAIRDCGVPVWYDAHIPGGSEWDEVIEERLAQSAFVIAFTSAAAIGSKYVRREIKFADALDRPVLAIVLEDVRLGHGLQMMMTQYQMLDARAADFQPRLRQAVRSLFA